MNVLTFGWNNLLKMNRTIGWHSLSAYRRINSPGTNDLTSSGYVQFYLQFFTFSSSVLNLLSNYCTLIQQIANELVFWNNSEWNLLAGSVNFRGQHYLLGILVRKDMWSYKKKKSTIELCDLSITNHTFNCFHMSYFLCQGINNNG